MRLWGQAGLGWHKLGVFSLYSHLKKIPLLRKHPWNRSQNRSYHLLKQNKDWTWHTTGLQHFHAKRLMFIHLGKWTRLLVCSTCRVEHHLEGQHSHSTNHSERITCPKGRLAWLPAKATTCNYQYNPTQRLGLKDYIVVAKRDEGEPK